MKPLERIEILEAELAALKQEVDAEKPKPTGVRWGAEANRDYWLVDCDGKTEITYDAEGSIDDHLYAIGNYFETQEQAEAYLEYQLATQAIVDYIAKGNAERDWSVDFNSVQANWIAEAGHLTNKIGRTVYRSYQMSNIRFYGPESVIKQSIKDLEKEYLIYFGYKG